MTALDDVPDPALRRGGVARGAEPFLRRHGAPDAGPQRKGGLAGLVGL